MCTHECGEEAHTQSLVRRERERERERKGEREREREGERGRERERERDRDSDFEQVRVFSSFPVVLAVMMLTNDSIHCSPFFLALSLVLFMLFIQREHFPFLDEFGASRNRTIFYFTLGRLLFMDDNVHKFKTFVAPLQQVSGCARQARAVRRERSVQGNILVLPRASEMKRMLHCEGCAEHRHSSAS